MSILNLQTVCAIPAGLNVHSRTLLNVGLKNRAALLVKPLKAGLVPQHQGSVGGGSLAFSLTADAGASPPLRGRK